jgi:hypothetical protein
MDTGRRWWPLSIVALAGLFLACGGVVRNVPRPGTGAETVAELAEGYAAAHRAKDPERLRDLDLTLALLATWMPINGDYKAALRGLFELQLDQVRVERMPPDAPPEAALHYLRSTPSGETAVSSVHGAVEGKLVLVGRRPDGTRTEVDPGLGVLWVEGRFYLEDAALIADEVARAIKASEPPRCRPIPLGTDGEFIVRLLDKDWEGANRMLDELERKRKAPGAAPPP